MHRARRSLLLPPSVLERKGRDKPPGTSAAVSSPRMAQRQPVAGPPDPSWGAIAMHDEAMAMKKQMLKSSWSAATANGQREYLPVSSTPLDAAYLRSRSLAKGDPSGCTHGWNTYAIRCGGGRWARQIAAGNLLCCQGIVGMCFEVLGCSGVGLLSSADVMCSAVVQRSISRPSSMQASGYRG